MFVPRKTFAIWPNSSGVCNCSHPVWLCVCVEGMWIGRLLPLFLLILMYKVCVSGGDEHDETFSPMPSHSQRHCCWFHFKSESSCILGAKRILCWANWWAYGEWYYCVRCYAFVVILAVVKHLFPNPFLLTDTQPPIGLYFSSSFWFISCLSFSFFILPCVSEMKTRAPRRKQENWLRILWVLLDRKQMWQNTFIDRQHRMWK